MSEPRLTPPLEPPPEIRRAIEIAVDKAWPVTTEQAPSSGWRKDARPNWRFASRRWVAPVELRRERPR
ncbi:MAG: hypothetical protein WB770_01375 [Acidimicrobiales bacterium]